jgi:hypothetical protein
MQRPAHQLPITPHGPVTHLIVEAAKNDLGVPFRHSADQASGHQMPCSHAPCSHAPMPPSPRTQQKNVKEHFYFKRYRKDGMARSA